MGILAFAGTSGLAQQAVDLTGRIIVKMLPDYRRPVVYALDSGPPPDGNGSLLALDATNGAVTAQIQLGRTPRDMDVDFSGQTLYVIHWDDTIWKIDLPSFTTVQVRPFPPPGNHPDDAHYHIKAGPSNLVYFVDARWAPRVHRFDFAAGIDLAQFELDEGFGAGDIAASRDGQSLYGWTQYGWNAGIASSWVVKIDVETDDFPVVGSSFRAWRDPLDAPIFLDASERRVFNKQYCFATTNLGILLAEFSEIIYGISYQGELAVGDGTIFDGATGAALTNLPFRTTVLAFSGDHRRLFLYDANAQQVFVRPVEGLVPMSLAPVNDAFTNALEIASRLEMTREFGTTSFATHEPGEPQHYNGDGTGSVWFTWVAPRSGSFHFSTEGSESGSFLAVYTGTGLTNLVPLAAGFSALVHVTQSQRYYIAADASPEQHGHVRVSVIPPPPPNDDFANALEIPSLSDAVASAESSTASATHEAGEPQHLTEPGVGSVWFTWVAPWSGNILFSTEGSIAGAFLAVYAGTSLTNLVSLAGGTTALVKVAQGERYHIAADALPGRSGQVRVSIYPRPPNDDFANAIELTGETGTFQGSNISASSEPGEPAWWLPGSSASIWWRWTAPATGDFSFSTAESTSSLVVLAAVYLGESISSLIPVSGPWITTGFNFRARVGQTYYFRFSGYDESDTGAGLYGTIAGSFRFTALPNAPPNDFFADRATLNGLTNVIATDNSLATFEPGESEWFSCGQGGQTLWWSYTAPQVGELHLAVGGPLRSVCALYRGDSLADLQWITASCNYPLVQRLQSGEAVQIRVDSALGEAGAMIVEAVFHPSPTNDAYPTNDAFADSVHLEGTNVTATGNNLGATLEPGEPRAPGGGPGATVWYSWLAPATGRAALNRGDIRTYGVYTGSTIDDLQPVRLAPDFLAVEGTVYHVQVDEVGSLGTGVGPFTFTIQLYPMSAAINDDFAEAVPLNGSTIGDWRWITGATMELGEPAHYGSNRCKSLWWRWQAPRHGTISFFAETSLVPEVVLAVYTGTSVESLLLVAKGTNSVRFVPVTGGDTYYIAAAVPEEAIGDVAFYSSALNVSTVSRVIPGNLLLDPSFEGTSLNLTNWQATLGYGGSVNERGGADGTTWIVLIPGGRLWQSFPTVPGRNYEVRFAFVGGPLRVLWDNQDLGVAEHPPEEGWHWTDFTVTAGATNSTLTFSNVVPYTYLLPQTNALGVITNYLTVTNSGPNVPLDDVSVVWLNEPPSIITPPTSASAIAGGSVAFVVGASGSPTLAFQWFFNGAPMQGKTRRTLVLDPVSVSHAGEYIVVVTNAFGAVTSPPVTLVVEALASPTIVLQPYGDTIAVGGYFALSVAAIGSPPLAYQWFQDGQELLGSTNSRLIFASIQLTNAGTYTVRVSNGAESVWSTPATLVVREVAEGGATLNLRNRFLEGRFWVERYVFDVDGVTRLSGTQYVAQLYAGPTLEMLRPAGEPKPFGTGFGAGLFFGGVVTIPTVAPESTAFAQIRAWEASAGASYEEARALGGKFGKSQILQVLTGGGLVPPRDLVGLQNFSLQAGLPRFTVGAIQLAEQREDGVIVWTLLGEAGFRYVVERASNDFVWRPLLVLTNISGTTTFIDPSPSPAANVFYRSRILD